MEGGSSLLAQIKKSLGGKSSIIPETSPLKIDFTGLNCCDGEVDPEPFIIPPTWNKTQHSDFLNRVWKQAASDLSVAENIFVIGYSLPKSDYFFRYLYAIGSIGKTRISRFWVCDPNGTDVGPFGNFRSLIGRDIGESKFKTLNYGFTSSVGLITKELLGEKAVDKILN